MIKSDLRRNFLTKSLCLASVLVFPSLASRYTYAGGEFEDYKSSMSTSLFQVEDEFVQYKEVYAQAYREYQTEISQFWAHVELSNRTSWVDYSLDMDMKRVLDFANNEIRISIQGNRLLEFSPQDSEREIRAALAIDISGAYRADPLLTKIVGGQNPDSHRRILGLDVGLAAALNKSARLQRKAGKKGELLTIVAKLPASSLMTRAQNFLPAVQQSAAKWQVPEALIMAIMHTESGFNPLARSHIPAFGLMQIVPKSAGRDASRLVFGRERLLKGKDLYKPETNIAMGAAYLHILDSQYLQGVNDAKSRQLCVIAAYNTGAGNVARAFTGTNSVKKALPLINSLSSKQVYAHLRSNLRYEEARNYLKKVTLVMSLYS